MEFITSNYFNTTTMATVGSGTLTVENLLYRAITLQYKSVGFNDDATTCSITINFGATQSVSRLGLIGMNWKDFTIFHSGVTANTLSLTSTGATTASDWSSNSESAMYLAFATVQAQSFTFDIAATQVANAEKALSYMHFGDVELSFDRIPNAKGYKPMYRPKAIEHTLSDGGKRLQFIDQKFAAQINLKFISASFRDSLYTLWRNNGDFAFVPFGTTTSWDQVLHTVVWPGKFDFFEYADDNPGTGFNGMIKLEEVT